MSGRTPVIPDSTTQRAILRVLVQNEPISRVDIGRLTGLSPASVTETVSTLITDNWAYVSGEDVSTGGRRPELLRFNRTRYAYVVTAVHPHRIHAVLLNLDPKPLHALHRAFQSPENALDTLFSTLEELLEWAKVQSVVVMGIAVSVPGTVEASTGTVGLSTLMDWHDLRLRDLLTERYSLPVNVENDANLAALAENRYGSGRDNESMIYITTSATGGSIVIDRAIYRGSTGGAGEIGHMSIRADGDQCACGNRGCLALYASEMALEMQVLRRLKQQIPSELHAILDSHGRYPTAQEIMVAARRGDSVATNALVAVAEALAVGIINVVNLFDIWFVVLGGSFANAGPVFIDRLNEIIADRAHRLYARAVHIVTADFRHAPELIGGLMVAFENTFGFSLKLSPAANLEAIPESIGIPGLQGEGSPAV